MRAWRCHFKISKNTIKKFIIETLHFELQREYTKSAHCRSLLKLFLEPTLLHLQKLLLARFYYQES